MQEKIASQHFSITINIIFSEAELTDINMWNVLFTSKESKSRACEPFDRYKYIRTYRHTTFPTIFHFHSKTKSKQTSDKKHGIQCGCGHIVCRTYYVIEYGMLKMFNV